MDQNIEDAYRLRDFDKHKAAEARAKADAGPRVRMQVRHEHQAQAAYKGHDIHIWRDDHSCDWYIQVRAPSGCFAYDGYWRDSFNMSLGDAITEACLGAKLWTPNV